MLTTVKGGTLIGKSGETGNAWGAHVHWDIDGDYDARGWLARKGVSLQTGGTVKWDNTIANLHKDETVLTAPLSKELERGINKLDTGVSTHYDINIEVNGSNMDANQLAETIMTKIKQKEDRTGRSKTIR